ncbi:MAG: hypothetical protein IJY57_00320 [Clostridia bacterium]|nr:hypothetical protein [Clostridia bacterium]
MFEDIKWILDNIFGINGDKFVIRKNVSKENIETCNGIAVDDDTTNTCALCVALNDTVFKNNNKPEYYHRNCKCQNTKYELTTVKLDFPISKITKYLFQDKSKKELMKNMGYDISDADFIYKIIADNAKDKFLKGDYLLGVLNCNGQKVNIILELYGKKDKKNKLYRFKTGWTAYPNGCLHNNTPFGGWVKEQK